MTYDNLKAQLQAAIRSGEAPRTPTREQRIDFAYGNTKIENPEVTRAMVERAVDAK